MEPTASDLMAELGSSRPGDGYADLCRALGAPSTPALHEDEPDLHHDWLLIRKRGLELGFVDAAYFAGQPADQWRSAGLVFDQLTFYSDTRDGVQPYTGALPFGLLMSDSRAAVRDKLAAYESSRRSYATDCWDTERCRIVVSYKRSAPGLDNVHLKLRAAPLPEDGRVQPEVGAQQWLRLFGLPAADPGLVSALAPLDLAQRIADDEDERELAFVDECGLVLYLEKASRLRLARSAPRRGLVFGAVKFFRARDLDARQYAGPLPFGLAFDDCPSSLDARIGQAPVRRDDGRMTGHALWHLPDCSVHVLYSTIENHLFRLMLMAPGYWQGMGRAE